MKKQTKKIVSILLIISLCLCGCNNQQEEKCPYEDFIVVDVFDSLANFEGIQSGWFAKIVKDKFNMELNIIAPNVAGGGDTIFETRAAAGNLGDLLIGSGENGRLQDMASKGLILNMEPYLEGKQILKYEKAIRNMNEEISPSGIYGIPTELSLQSPTVPSEVQETSYGPYVRWDLYKELGYPKMNTLEDILPVLQQMQKLEPVNEMGEKTYGFAFFKDWDANLMTAVKQPCCFYGYDEYGFLLVKADGSEYQSILDSDSFYNRVLKLYFDANQLGLVDPTSPTMTYETFAQKYEDGQILYCPWPWSCQEEYNTLAHTQEGKGFMMADIADMQIYSNGCCPTGNTKIVMAIGAKAEDPQRMADFIDWLYSSEGININGFTAGSGLAGPEGLCWEYGEDGPYLTEFGEKALLDKDADIPEEWGGGTWKDGRSELNVTTVTRSEVDERGYPYQYKLWDSVTEREETPLEADWRSKMQADTTMEYLQNHNKILVSPGSGYMATIETTEETAIRRQCRAVIQKYSWEMVFAENEEEFYALQEKMQKEAISLGYEQILAYDLENAKAKEQDKLEMVAEYTNSNN